MPKLVIDEREIEVPVGTKVIDAAERLDIFIPRFCYLESLGAVGACRVCAVKMLKGPFKGVQMSCMIDAMDGMVVSTTDEEAVDFRRHVIEWLMLHHPHDCPVCDEGGQCLLQDMTVSGGHGIRRYQGKKRTYHNQYLGPFVAHEMNRCIQCYRCSRFYQEYAGYRDLGVMQISNRVFFGRYQDGQLESPFSGNLVDICPTGVYTDIPARYRARFWDLERAPSLCIHCSLGCNTIGNGRYREIIRVESRANLVVNGCYICDRGRFGFSYADNPERPRHPKIGSQETSWDDAVKAAAEKLTRIARESGPKAVACLSSPRSSIEGHSALRGVSNLLQWNPPRYFFDPALERKVKAATSSLDERLAVSMTQVEKADFILAAGVDPVNEAPMLALAMRQAFRKGATVVVMDPRPVSLPLEFEHLPVAPWNMDRCLEMLVGKAIRSAKETETPPQDSDRDAVPADHPFDSAITDRVANLAPRLADSQNPVILCGVDVVRESTPSFAAGQASLLKQHKEGAGLFYVLPGANAFGAGLLTSSNHGSFLKTLEGIEEGSIKALVAVESDPFVHFPDVRRLERALDKLELLIVMDYIPSLLAQKAHVLLPTSTIFEAGSSFVNQEGRLQTARAVHHGGTPVDQQGGGSHPPRIYGLGVPGDDFKPAWQALGDLGRALSLSEGDLPGEWPSKFMEEAFPSLAQFKTGGLPAEGIRIIRETAAQGLPPPESITGAPADGGMELILAEWTFGTEELSSLSDHIRKVEKEPVLTMHREEAVTAGFSDGDSVVIHVDEETSVKVKLCLADNMARGVLVLPRHHGVEWQKLKSFSPVIARGKIEKTAASTDLES